jgi:hypothetical protein
MDKTTLDPEVLKTQDKLTPEQEEQIALDVQKEYEGKGKEGEEGKKSAADAPEGDTEGEEEGKEEESEEGKGKKEESESEAGKEGEEGKEKKEPTAAEKKAAEEAEKVAKAEFEKNVVIYMDENSISEKQAREELEHIGKIQEKYAKDPVKMGKALLNLNRAYSESQAKLKEITETPKENQLMLDGKLLSPEESREKMVEMYRKAYPKLTEDLDDDKVHELSVAEYKKEYARFMEKQKGELVTKATAKREELIKSLREEDKPFLKDIKAILDKTEDAEIFAKDFDFADYVFWARGRNFHKVLKEREDAAYKRGLEQKKILGAKPDGTGAEPKGSAKGGKTVTLTDDEKVRALAMYESLQIPEAEKFKMFIDYKNGG